MAQRQRRGISFAMLQDFEAYYAGGKDALIGYEEVSPYRHSNLATVGVATTFNQHLIARLNPKLNRQAFVGVFREARASSLSFEGPVKELRIESVIS